MPTILQEKLADMLYLAASKHFLKKAVLSKCEDKEVLKSVATLFEKSRETVVQIETFKKDGKAIHKNFAIGDSSILSNIEAYSQINLIGDGADAERIFPLGETPRDFVGHRRRDQRRRDAVDPDPLRRQFTGD